MANELTLRDAVRLLGFDADVSRTKTDVRCPFCASPTKRKTLHFAFDALGPDNGAFRCARCDTGGTAMTLWALVRGFSPENLKEAAKDYHRFMGDDGKKIELPPVVIAEKSDVPCAPLSRRNMAYNMLLEVSALSDKHKENLLSRGLSEEAIEKGGYKSFPQGSGIKIAQLLQEKGCNLEGVPGFYVPEGGSRFTLRETSSGILIPQRNSRGMIQGFQIRLDKVGANATRYISLSTLDMPHGAGTRGYCHFVKGARGIKDVLFTEGALKADVTSCLTGFSVLAVPGVNSLKFVPGAIRELKKKGLKKISVAYDMDYKNNPNVLSAMEKLKGIIEDENLPYTVLNWDDSFKGIDDFALSLRK